jgi:polysaccharide pyruvyl transferase WcaK-like protein
MSFFPDSPDLNVGILNTSIATENAGDFIIMEAAGREIDRCLPLAYKVHLTTHEKLSRTSLRLARKAAFSIACGTNLLHSHMEIIKQWNIGLLASWFLKPVVLLGVGWRGQAKRRTTPYTRLLLRSVLSREHLHSVRDSYTEMRLREAGVQNVVNTSCPTMWQLTPEHCAGIPAGKGDAVVVTFTDYSPDLQRDGQLLDLLKRCYRRVYFWRQGSGDGAYLASLAGTQDVEILPSSLSAYDELLADRTLSLDYVGTRLHGGIRALQHKRRAWIIAVDHRAEEKERDFHLPVLNRYAPSVEIERAVCEPAPCRIRIPLENICRWREQFLGTSSRSSAMKSVGAGKMP